MPEQKVQTPVEVDTVFFYGYVIVLAALCIMTVVYGIRASFGALISGALSLSMLVQGCLAVVMGGLNDRFGPRLVLTFCSVFFGAGCLLMSRIGSVWHIYLFYGVIVGIGMSGFLVPLLSTIARWFTKRRNVMSGMVFAGLGIGSLIAPPVANWLIFAYNWRTSYLALGAIALLVGVISAQFFKRDPAEMGLAPYGRVEAKEASGDNAGLSFKEAVHTGQFWMLYAIYVCQGFCFFSVMVHLVPHVTDMGISATRAANILAALGGSGIIGNIVLGGAGDRIGNKYVCVIGITLMTATMFWLLSINDAWVFYLFVTIFGIANGGCLTSESPIVAWLFGVRSHGVLLGMISFGFTVGAAIGPLLTGYIFDLTGSYQSAFIIIGVICFISLILITFLRPIHSRASS
ncbi:MAG: MFS transporter [Deltaproteobacteria bacterium]|nr:MFS transporter [Deltaproteobacteria bacterium]